MANLTYKPGDWQCRKCGRHNFASRYWCRWIECGAKRNDAQGQIEEGPRPCLSFGPPFVGPPSVAPPAHTFEYPPGASANIKREREDPPPLECPDPMYESLAKRVKVLEEALEKERTEAKLKQEYLQYDLEDIRHALDQQRAECKELHEALREASSDWQDLHKRIIELEAQID